MHITIIDSHTLNPGDLSWKWLENYGEVQIFERTKPNLEDYIDRCKNAEVIIINKAGLVLGEELFSQLPQLKLIMVSATGFNIIDTTAARIRNIIVTNVPGYGTNTVAQHTIGLILEVTNRVGAHAQSVRDGSWATSIDWCFTLNPIIELAGKTLGIIGYGQIGQKVAEIANALGMNVLYNSNSNKETKIGDFAELDSLIEKSDFISLHCPANEKTMKMVNQAFLSKMKKTACLINTSRGQLIDEQALADALNEGVIAGVALDVLSQEPPNASNPLLTAQNCLITPHIAWVAKEARQRIMIMLEENLKAFLSDNPINVVN
jgi:glycerate dehydrogenase